MSHPKRALGAVLVLLLAAGGVSAQDAVAPRLAPGRVEISVNDLHCATCAKKVARKLYAVKGVKKVSASLEKDLVVVLVPADKPVPAAAIWSAVAASGDVKPVELRFGDQRLDAKQMKPLLASARAAVAR